MYDVLGRHLEQVGAHLGPLDVPWGEENIAVVLHQEGVVLLQEGKEIITRVIKPQINYMGELKQVAEVEVSQGG